MLPTRNAMSAVPAASMDVRGEESVDHRDYYAIVWLDYDEAYIICFSAGVFDPRGARPEHWSRHLRAKIDVPSGMSSTAKRDFYFDVVRAFEDAKAVVLAGISTAKTEFVKFLHRETPETFDRISGIESMPRMTDDQLVAEARRLFARTDHAHLSSCRGQATDHASVSRHPAATPNR